MNITQQQAKELLAGLFVPRKEPLEGVCFSNDYMDKANAEKYAIYEAVSDAMHDSGLSHDFSYAVAEKAVDVLTDRDEIDWLDADDLTNLIDNAVPVYNGELMEIYANDWGTVDKACEELGIDKKATSVERARLGWYYAIEQMAQAIISNLGNLTN